MNRKQLFLMITSLVVAVTFFMPWVTLDPNFTTFASSNAWYSGYTLIKGVGYGVQMLSAFGTAYSFPFPAQILYLGYILWLIPVLGILGTLFIGFRKKGGRLLIRIQAILALLLTGVTVIAIIALPDLKMLLSDMLDISFGFISMGISAILALIFSF